MGKKLTQDGCASGKECGFITSERNRYFTGKYMAARDFECDQDYFLSHHRLHNRVMHGWGVVCGLGVVPHPNKDCQKRWVVVRAGLAIDCCGRELIVPKDIAVELPLPAPQGTEKSKQAKITGKGQMFGSLDLLHREDANPLPEPGASKETELTGPFLICLRYTEDQIELVPALHAECTCDPQRREANRVRERVEIDFVDLNDVPPGCWPTAEGDSTEKCKDDCDEDLPGPAGICLTPECPCGECVPLALISPGDEGGLEIDMCGRRQLPLPGDFLTHIVKTNWTHGGEVSLTELREGMEYQGRLTVTFSRKLMPAQGNATGINPFTFIVQYGGVQETLEFLPSEGETPKLSEDDPCTAVFVIDEDYLGKRKKGAHERDITNTTVYVTLKCDFIRDCHGNPVDGNFPTGNGVPGGTFESWFFLSSGEGHYGDKPDVIGDKGDKKEVGK